MEDIYGKRNIFLLWAEWHFRDVPKEILRGWRNFLLFNLNFFSIPTLLKTLFSYWHKYRWGYGGVFDVAKNLYVFFSNSISRILGAIVRLFLIAVGLITEVFIFFSGIAVLVLWLLLPALTVLTLIKGIEIIIYYGA